ncbi:MAG TPA: alpha/beta hydrolase [Spirochaetia bacterium]|mgnify:CR=1 FL=1|nr:alpha/beta hydrolase [Spirochaetia bacterium]
MVAVRLRLSRAALAACAASLIAAAAGCAGSPPADDGYAAVLGELGAAPRPFIEAGGATVRAFVIGDPRASRRVVFIHGWSGSGAEFVETALRLSRARPDVLCFCVDLPGSGSSDKPADAPYDVPYFRAVIAEAVEAAATYGLDGGRSDDVTLVGHSLGGHLSVAYAASGDTRIARLALVSPAGWPGEVGAIQAWASKNEFALSAIPRLYTEGSYLLGHRLMMVFGQSSYSEAVPRYTGRFLDTDEGRAALEKVTRNALETDYIDDELALVSAPVLLVWGRDDAVLPFSYSEKFLSRLPAGAEFAAIDRCGHLPQCERPDELAALLAAFIGD